MADRRGLVTTLLAVRHTLAVAAANLNQLAKVANATGEVSPGHPSDRGQGGGRRRDRGRLSCNPQSRYVSKSPGSSPGYAKPSTDNSAVGCSNSEGGNTCVLSRLMLST